MKVANYLNILTRNFMALIVYAMKTFFECAYL